MKMLKIIFSLALILPVVACGGGEPSEKDMKQAVIKTMSEVMGAMSLMGANSAFEVTKVKKTACVKAKDKPGYQCDIAVTVKMGGNEQTSSDSARFVKGDDGWEMFK